MDSELESYRLFKKDQSGIAPQDKLRKEKSGSRIKLDISIYDPGQK